MSCKFLQSPHQVDMKIDCICYNYFLWYSTILETYPVTRFNNSQFFEKILFSQSKASLEIDPTFVDKEDRTTYCYICYINNKMVSTRILFFYQCFFLWKNSDQTFVTNVQTFLNNMLWIMFEHIFLSRAQKILYLKLYDLF